MCEETRDKIDHLERKLQLIKQQEELFTKQQHNCLEAMKSECDYGSSEISHNILATNILLSELISIEYQKQLSDLKKQV
jgi:hypothetical protein